MKRFTWCITFVLALLSSAVANESITYYIPQPIVAFGDTEGWTLTGEPHIKEAYMILGMPYFQKGDHGPIYQPIADPHMMANSEADEGVLRDCNLLSLHRIGITRKFDSRIVHLDLTKAKVKKDSIITLEVAAYAAMECIRIVSHRYSHKIELKIIPPKDEKLKWKVIEDAFNKHDKTKPFQKLAEQVVAPDGE